MRLTALALLLLSGAAQAACQFGTPVVSSLGTYDYVQNWTQNIQIPVVCDGGSAVSTVRISTADGVFEPATGRFVGTMRSGSEQLLYFVPNATQLRVLGGTLGLDVTVPAGQWGAPTRSYADSLTITIDF
ncbi:hypothetical protein [Deinococcus aerophilus]|uniref:Spore coat protein U domain-containing protein n=1 Tax=Deinococcus aerophilus TaxID=522488 RepID=A0ABQ2H1A5_9DEIO|nr:hypothetical protein [Deinococcus aerophilus]GGM21826.1 hypothetical protein GCM10010841_32100 [Deinococcus aerophilus]